MAVALENGVRFALDPPVLAVDLKGLNEVEEEDVSDEDFVFDCGVSASNGRRSYMEDRHSWTLSQLGFGGPEVGVAVVFDGHGGDFASDYCESNFLDLLLGHDVLQDDIEKAFRDTIKTLDEKILVLSEKYKTYAGTTLNAVIVTPGKVVCGNVGDSRSILCRGGEVVPLSTDHSPSRPSEKERIEKAGGFVTAKGVNGVMSVSRALGDLDMKGHKTLTFPGVQLTADLVVSEPEILEMPLLPEDEFIIVASDGLFENMSMETAVKVVRKELSAHGDPTRSSNALIKLALNSGTMDNITALVVLLKEPSRENNKIQSAMSRMGLRMNSQRMFFSVHGKSSKEEANKNNSVHSEPGGHLGEVDDSPDLDEEDNGGGDVMGALKKMKIGFLSTLTPKAPTTAEEQPAADPKKKTAKWQKGLLSKLKLRKEQPVMYEGSSITSGSTDRSPTTSPYIERSPVLSSSLERAPIVSSNLPRSKVARSTPVTQRNTASNSPHLKPTRGGNVEKMRASSSYGSMTTLEDNPIDQEKPKEKIFADFEQFLSTEANKR